MVPSSPPLDSPPSSSQGAELDTRGRGTGGSVTVGIDEAGRGAVLGPLVLAACALDSGAEQVLAALGVADSKTFGSSAAARARRASLGLAIREHAVWLDVLSIPAEAVDRAVSGQGLNRLEQEVAARLARRAPRHGRLVLDGARLFAPLARRLPRAEARNRADRHVLAVAAASILAKVARDKAFGAIAERYAAVYGPLGGGGYPNRATASFLDRYWADHARLPPETRLTWGWAPVASRVSPRGARGEALPLPFHT